MSNEQELVADDWDLLHEVCGVEERLDTNKIREEMLQYLWNNHKDAVVEAYKETWI